MKLSEAIEKVEKELPSHIELSTMDFIKHYSVITNEENPPSGETCEACIMGATMLAVSNWEWWKMPSQKILFRQVNAYEALEESYIKKFPVLETKLKSILGLISDKDAENCIGLSRVFNEDTNLINLFTLIQLIWDETMDIEFVKRIVNAAETIEPSS